MARFVPRRGPSVRGKRPRGWSALVPVVAFLAGILFATSATVARGTDLRSDGSNGLVGLVRAAQQQVSSQQATLSRLDAEVKTETDDAAQSNAGVAAQKRRSDPLMTPSGLTALSGPGLEVTLDDSHDAPADPSIDPNDTVVHQSDIQAVVNALWAGGAEAMSIAGQRVIATSAVRCVGNTLLLNGRVYSPAFRIVVIGPSEQMRAQLDRSPGVALYRQAADALGLTYRVQDQSTLRVPAYDGPVTLNSAKVAH